MFVGGKNMRYGKSVPAHFDRTVEAENGAFAVVYRQRTLVEQMNKRAQERRKGGQQKTAFRQLHKFVRRKKLTGRIWQLRESLSPTGALSSFPCTCRDGIAMDRAKHRTLPVW